MKLINKIFKLNLLIIFVFLLVTDFPSSLFAMAADDSASSSIPQNKVIFAPSTDLTALRYSGCASFEPQLLDLSGEKPVIEIYNTTHMPFNLSVSYTDFEVGSIVNSDLKLAIIDKTGDITDNHGNTYRIFEPGVMEDIYTSQNGEFISFVPWGEGSSDLLKVYLPSYRHDLDSKDIRSVVTWLLELTPTPVDDYHTWDDWSAWTDNEQEHIRSRFCSVCGIEESETHLADSSLSEWIFGGDGCQRVCLVVGCGLQADSHTSSVSEWIDKKDGILCYIKCLICHIELQSAMHAWDIWQSGGVQTHFTSCVNCHRLETAAHPWTNWSAWTLVGANHIMSRSCSSCTESESLSHTATGSQSAWGAGGSGCRRTCTVTGCGLQTATHVVSHSVWGAGGSGCRTTCTVSGCGRQTQTHAIGGASWSAWAAGGSGCSRTRTCTTCGRINVATESHEIGGSSWSAWAAGGSGCLRTRTCTTCSRANVDSDSHTLAQSGWQSGGSGCRRICNTCNRQTATHSTSWGNWSGWSTSGSNHVRSGTCTASGCGRSGGSQSHAIAWSSWAQASSNGQEVNVCKRTCTGGCSISQEHSFSWGNWVRISATQCRLQCGTCNRTHTQNPAAAHNYGTNNRCTRCGSA